MINTLPHNWKLVFLKQNPFPSVPPRYSERSVWAGFPDLRRQLDELYKEALTTARSQIVLCRGEQGSGKTHAAAFACSEDYLAIFQPFQQVQGVEVFSLTLPKDEKLGNEFFYHQILESLPLHKFQSAVKEAITSYTKDEAIDLLQRLCGNGTLAKSLWLFAANGLQDGTEQASSDETAERQELIERYLFSQTDKSDLKRLGLSRDIQNAQDRFDILTCLLQCLIGLNSVEDLKSHKRIILWIDEMEDLLLYATRYHKPFAKGLCSLIDRLPNYLSIIMNFTVDSPDNAHEIEFTAGNDILYRVTDQLFFKEPNEEQAFEYVTDLLAAYRTEKPEEKGLPVSYPFEEDALRSLITEIESRVPRRLNQRCSDVISKAFQIGLFTAPGVGIINKEFVRTVEERHL